MAHTTQKDRFGNKVDRAKPILPVLVLKPGLYLLRTPTHSWWKEGPSPGGLSSQALGLAFDTPIFSSVPLKGNRTVFCTTCSYFRGALVSLSLWGSSSWMPP